MQLEANNEQNPLFNRDNRANSQPTMCFIRHVTNASKSVIIANQTTANVFGAVEVDKLGALVVAHRNHSQRFEYVGVQTTAN